MYTIYYTFRWQRKHMHNLINFNYIEKIHKNLRDIILPNRLARVLNDKLQSILKYEKLKMV